jgi:plasmid stability protein
MATITVKNIPDELFQRLKKMAEANRRSLNNEIIYCLEQAVSRDKEGPESFLEKARRLRELTRNYMITDKELNMAMNNGRP